MLPRSMSRAVAGPSSAPACRTFSSTPSTSSFFFRRPAPPNARQIFSQLEAARRADRLDLVLKLYPALRDAVRTTPLTPSESHADFRRLMAFVASTGNFGALLRMFNDLSTLGYTTDIHDHHTLLKGMTQAGKPTKALRWIEGIEGTYGLTPRVKSWNVVLDGFRRAADLEGMRKVLSVMKVRGVEPDAWTYNTFIAASLASGDLDAARQLRREMDAAGVPSNLVTEVTLLDGFIEAGEMRSAGEVRRRLNQVIASWVREPPPAVDIAVLNVVIKHECRTAGFEAGLRLGEQLVSDGLSLDNYAFSSLVQTGVAAGVQDAEGGIHLLERLEASLGFTAPTQAWTLVECKLLANPGGLSEALKIYHEARDRSVQPDSAMVHPLLVSLFDPAPTPQAFETAKQLYEDLASSSRAYHLSPDTGIFSTLLRACADPVHPDFEFSNRLTADMRERRIRPEGAALTWQIVAQMRVAASWKQAFEAYDALRSVNVEALSTQNYNTILAAFTSLPLASDDASVPPTLFIQDILADMRKTQNPLNSATYTLLLSYYSRLEAPSVSAVAHIHSLIKVDSNLDPDAALFNALMTAYSRVGAAASAFRIWESMRASHQVDNVSVSIVLDTCGWSPRPEGLTRARRIWDDLRSEHFPLNSKNYETWVECLCRQGDLDAAERVVFEELVPGSPLVATAGMAEVLLKFARRNEGDSRGEKIWVRLEKERPDLVPLVAPRLASKEAK